MNVNSAIRPGLTHRIAVSATQEQTAHALGNPGVHVVATIFMIGFIEECCGRSVHPFLATDQASVGTHVNIHHKAPIQAGKILNVESRLVAVSGTHLDFEAEITCGEVLLMSGTHRRSIVSLDALLKRTKSG